MAFESVPPEMSANMPEWLRRIARVTNSLLQGKTNNTGSVTLTANAGSTVVTLASGRLGIDTVILMQPTTANAAGAIATTYESARDVSAGTFTLTHTNTASTDRVFKFVLVG